MTELAKGMSLPKTPALAHRSWGRLLMALLLIGGLLSLASGCSEEEPTTGPKLEALRARNSMTTVFRMRRNSLAVLWCTILASSLSLAAAANAAQVGGIEKPTVHVAERVAQSTSGLVGERPGRNLTGSVGATSAATPPGAPRADC